jgi:chorismate mutase
MDISDWRKKIDELDIEIVRLISQRAAAARAIGELKKTADLPVYEDRWTMRNCCMCMSGLST